MSKVPVTQIIGKDGKVFYKNGIVANNTINKEKGNNKGKLENNKKVKGKNKMTFMMPIYSSPDSKRISRIPRTPNRPRAENTAGLSTEVFIENLQTVATISENTIINVTKVPIIDLTLSGGLWYASFGEPEFLVGNTPVTIESADPVGQKIIPSKRVQRVDVKFCLQYSSQGGSTRRTFTNLLIDNVIRDNCASGVPGGSNNWRGNEYLLDFNISEGAEIQVIANTSATGTLTLNSGNVFFTF